MSVEPVVKDGQILCLRLFDIGDEIDLERAERALEGVPGISCNRRSASKMEAQTVPLRLELGRRELEIIEIKEALGTTLSIHLYSSGSVSVTFAIDVTPGAPLGSLTSRLAALYVSRDLETLARAELDKLVPSIRQAVTGYHEWSGFENYTIVRVYELASGLGADDVLAWPGLAKLVVGETSKRDLSKKHREEILEYAFAYLDNDLVVVDWNTAFILDPQRDPTMVEMLELTNSHLLNLRYYDDRLDREIERIHTELGKVHGIFDRRVAKVAQDAIRNIVSLSEIAERVENAAKVVGDHYTSRVYRAAITRLRVGAWNDSIARKQRLVAEAYGMLKSEVEMRRTLMIEIAIVALIVIEVVLAFVPH